MVAYRLHPNAAGCETLILQPLDHACQRHIAWHFTEILRHFRTVQPVPSWTMDTTGWPLLVATTPDGDAHGCESIGLRGVSLHFEPCPCVRPDSYPLSLSTSGTGERAGCVHPWGPIIWPDARVGLPAQGHLTLSFDVGNHVPHMRWLRFLALLPLHASGRSDGTTARHRRNCTLVLQNTCSISVPDVERVFTAARCNTGRCGPRMPRCLPHRRDAASVFR